MTTPQQPTSSGGNAFTRKAGPLPLWGWAAIILVLVALYAYYKKSKSASTTSSAAEAAGNAPGGVDSSLVPQFINQSYIQETPPTAPNVTVNNTVPVPPVAVTTPAAPVSTPSPMPPTGGTISGAPGSFTTGLAGGQNEWTSTGKYSLNTLAKSHGMTAQQLIANSEAQENNPMLKAYVAKGNFNAMLPAGVQIFIPNANWKLQK